MQLSITDWIRRQEVLLLIIYNNHNKICDIFSFSKIKTQHIPTVFLARIKNKKTFQVHANNVQLLRHNTYCPIILSY